MHENAKYAYPFVTDLETLRLPSQEVDVNDPETRALAMRMDRLLGNPHDPRFPVWGVGLSAIQLGFAKRVIVVAPGKRIEPLADQHYLMANPKIIWVSSQTDRQAETCLSILEPGADMSQYPPPRLKVMVERPVQVGVLFYDLVAASWRYIVTDNPYTARVIQHEVDHLTPRLITDYLPENQRLRA